MDDDPVPAILAFPRDERRLLVIDGREHLIEAVAPLAERIFEAAPEAHILATSREALRVQSEFVQRLPPLGCPPEEHGLTAEGVLAFPAARLFVERARTSGASLEPAAGHVEALGLHGIAELL